MQSAFREHQLGHLADAISLYEGVLASFPRHAPALHYMGVALAQLGRPQEALQLLKQALAIGPADKEVLNNLGIIFAELGRYQEAIASFDRALVCDPQSIDCLLNRARAYAKAGDCSRAISSYTSSLQSNSQCAEAYYERGKLLLHKGQIAASQFDFDTALKIRPIYFDALLFLCEALRRLHRYEEALQRCNTAIDLEANSAKAHNLKGAILANMGHFDDAMNSFNRAISIAPHYAESIWNKSHIELRNGDWTTGWKNYEARLIIQYLVKEESPANGKRWNGEAGLRGQTILLRAEQGFGDTIQFCRFCQIVSACGATVILSAPNILHSLLLSVKGIRKLIEEHASTSSDYYCPLMSLPNALGIELSTLPNSTPYMRASDESIKKWSSRLSLPTKFPVVGIAWSGRAAHPKDQERSIALTQLAPIFRSSLQWISLQKEVSPSDLHHMETFGIIHVEESLSDFSDLAALMSNVDLVVCVDTAVAHLAGALGVPVWILLPHVADWRWLQGREDSPWYPTARLFRQSSRGDWHFVVEAVSAALQQRFG